MRVFHKLYFIRYVYTWSENSSKQTILPDTRPAVYGPDRIYESGRQSGWFIVDNVFFVQKLQS